ncbi:hypothetical protein NEUTE1DRAFT_38501 [Neurospora tetrasperma FGSC 2508]|uniref:Uncharacterized protein n=1 Tax=Neurospora tetrasperma (strain FGSC 2508 / ATCC MYA-4615 / P0657) TaxID=510951 RepID=F8MI69_NEUT8|nr:uncharacterized protein NEUTE1DRAFT_38501 [Neurospora tetrasperma FGSC 2508]EGO58925.1 hypothetical protein NEUTE1DRAFT_38501 [Neurospora tetrasperma FGSC 2508]EGZ73025.1 hypothetical protein NEUTE2DRAFT_61442 [Neurospora tetrasperma FGSC 2509]
MPHSTRSESIRNNTTMSSLSADAYTIAVDPEVAGLIVSATNYPPINGHPPTNGHLTNGYHLDESNTGEEVQMHSPAHRAATGSSGQPSNHIRTPGAVAGAGAETGAVITGTTINGTHIRDITINGTHITRTTISGTHISGITINGTNVIQTTINGVPTSTSGTTINGTNNNNNNLNGTTPISRAPPPVVDEHEAEAEAAFASTGAPSVITSSSRGSNERGNTSTVHERSGSTSLDTFGVIIVYPRAMFDINPISLGDLLRREFGDPWERDPPVWEIEVSTYLPTYLPTYLSGPEVLEK